MAKAVSTPARASASAPSGLAFTRRWTREGVHPFDEITWERRDAVISSEGGKDVFRQEGVEVPEFWSQLATNVVVSKYFRGHVGTPERETSARQLIGRVANTITDWGIKDGYFSDEVSAEIFRAELTHLLINQKMAFNSPVWFNVGIEERPQCSACFINSVTDTMDSIMDLAKTEAMLFKYGSGAGVNLSPIRGSQEKMSGGGIASGPVSFMKGYDAFAGVVKSGGKTRRAAKMIVLDVNHPDIEAFIDSKAHEEQKAWALIEAGYDGSFTGEAYGSVFFQNANHSVRVTDQFMQAVEDDRDWTTREVTTNKIDKTYKARDLMRQMAEAAWICGDPGIQYDTTINEWHTCSNTDRIYASNPCSEYMFLNDTACNLASLNLMRFVRDDGSFDWSGYRYAVKLTITAQEILVSNASYPTPKIEEMSHKFRTLGIGYANLGALLMSRGLAYDSSAGRYLAANLTSVMTGESYAQSAKIARALGPFSEFEKNRDPMLWVIQKHFDAADKVPMDVEGFETSMEVWGDALEWGSKYGFRNAQVSVLAPTGTISFLMDCDTTGVEPAIALISYKKLVGEGYLKLVNGIVPKALESLGYDWSQIDTIVKYLEENETIEGAPGLDPQHLPVFDCAFKPKNGTRSIHYTGHLRMMAAVQPFLSGAISKTVNMPEDATVEDIENVYIEGWKMGLKAIAIYRDGSKRSQPLATSKGGNTTGAKGSEPEVRVEYVTKPLRVKLPEERPALTHRFSVSGHEGYITVGMYENGQPGEIFLHMSKEGSTMAGMMDAFATMTSIALQYGVPLKDLVNKFSHMRFEPAGFTGNAEVPIAKSIVDYIFRWLEAKFLKGVQPEEASAPLSFATTVQPNVVSLNGHSKGTVIGEVDIVKPNVANSPTGAFENQSDAPPCLNDGTIMVRNGSCYKCLNCGETSGCS